MGSNVSSSSAFADAIKYGDLRTVESLISMRAVDVNAPMGFLDTTAPPLVIAAWSGRKPIVEALLNAGANVNSADGYGRTACHLAAKHGHVDVLAVLLAHGPDLSLAGSHTALQYAIDGRNCNVRAVLMLIEAGAPLAAVGDHVLCTAAARSPVLVRALLDRGVTVRALRDRDGRSPLMRTCDLELLDMLVNVCGCDLTARDSLGNTISHAFAFGAKRESIRWLIDTGVDFDVVNQEGSTPLHRSHDVDNTLLILAAGANVHARDTDGNTACHLCATSKSLGARNVLHALLAGGANLDIVNNRGISSRQIVAERGWSIDHDDVDAARRRMTRMRLDFVRHRALQICIGLQSCGLDALQMCEILLHSCGRMAPLIAFHQWWALATTVKHFRQH
jgi:ankyrin repeat protein